MEPDRSNRISDLFHAALARPPEERTAFLHAECGGDDALRREVESLLEYERASFLERQVVAAVRRGTPDLVGRRLGPYQIVAHLGSGGMGDVYRAHDEKLGRDVAIKILPPHLTADSERRLRFAREARVLASLNHPHIGAIFGLEEADGTTALVLELVEGPTLAQRLERGPLPIGDALAVALQIADALDAAHERGIVHRDLKPANVVLQGGEDGALRDVRAKVLDFGLAKALRAGASDASARPASVDVTDEGRILGTAGYMSPEQMRGLPIDRRTDIWAFGCVLYEMITGQALFTGETVTDVMAAVVTKDPDWRALPPGTPPRVRLLLDRCLQKDPKRRLRDIGDARFELVTSVEAVPERPTRRGDAFRRRAGPILVAIAGALAIAATAGAWWYRRSAGPPSLLQETFASVDRPLRRLTFDPGLQSDAAFSPDGRSIAYAPDRAGNSDIWIQPLDGGKAYPITSSHAAETQPAWSPDGARIVFRSDEGTGGLFRTPASGGPVTQVTTFGQHPVWSADGTEILFRMGLADRHIAIHAVSADGGGSPRELAGQFLSGGTWTWIAPHPDGRISAIGVHPERRFGFYTLSRDGRDVVASTISKQLPLDPEELTRSARFQWNAQGTALYLETVRQQVENIWRVRVDPKTLAWLAAERLTTGAGADVAAALSRDGTRLAFTVEQKSVRLWSYPLDAAAGRITGPGVPISPDDGRAFGAMLSPDGRLVVYSMQRAGSPQVDLLLTDIDAKKTELVGVNATAPAWSPDSRMLAYVVPRGDSPLAREWALVVRPLGGSERIVRDWNGTSFVRPTGWTPDGRSILASYLSPAHTGIAKIVSWPVEGQASPQPRILLEHPTRGLWQVGMSSKGQWLTFVAEREDSRGRVGVIVARPDTPREDWLTVAGDHLWTDKPRWSPDGRLLYFISNQGSSFFNLWAVRFDPVRGALLGAPFQLTRFDSPALVISPDVTRTQIGIAHQRAVLSMSSVRGSIWLLDRVDR